MKYEITSANWRVSADGDSPLEAAVKALRKGRPKELGRIVKAKPESGRNVYLSARVVIERSGLKYKQS